MPVPVLVRSLVLSLVPLPVPMLVLVPAPILLLVPVRLWARP